MSLCLYLLQVDKFDDIFLRKLALVFFLDEDII